MSTDKKNLIVTVADANFITQAKQLFSSVYFKAGWTGDYLLLSHNLSASDKEWFESRGIIVYEPPLLADRPFSEKAYPPLLLSKFYLFTEYFKQWQKVIFLDVDIIVQSSLEHLLKASGFAATKAMYFRLRREFVDNCQFTPEFKKKYSLRTPSLTTGVFVLDTEIINSRTFEEIMSLYREFKDICQYGEESILNLYFYKQWNELPVIYNAAPWYLNNRYGLIANKQTVVIIHFICYAYKPWHQENAYYQEWSANLALADQIQAACPVKASYSWSEDYLRRYLRFLKWQRLAHMIYLDKIIGWFGLLIKKITPKLYQRINLKKE
jgi:lipopolysaccharide biosynthesis glycosyltransferase